MWLAMLACLLCLVQPAHSASSEKMPYADLADYNTHNGTSPPAQHSRRPSMLATRLGAWPYMYRPIVQCGALTVQVSSEPSLSSGFAGTLFHAVIKPGPATQPTITAINGTHVVLKLYSGRGFKPSKDAKQFFASMRCCSSSTIPFSVPLAECELKGMAVQVLRFVKGDTLQVFLERQRAIARERLGILQQFAFIYKKLHELHLTFHDAHPFNWMIEPQSHVVTIIDLDRLLRAPAMCACWPQQLCGGRAGCLLTNPPEAEAHCSQRACSEPSDMYRLAQLALWLLIPAAPSAAIEVIDSRIAGGSNSTTIYKFTRGTPPVMHTEGWMRHIVLSLSRRNPTMRPSAEQLLVYISHCERQLLPLKLSAELSTSPFAPFGYLVNESVPSTLFRMTTRREMILRELARDGNLSSMVPQVVDWGSNEGYFSLSVMAALPKAIVYSVDPNETYFGVQPMDSLLEHMNKHMPYESHRSHQCVAKLTLKAIRCLGEYAQNRSAPVFDFQLGLSIFHWLPIHTRNEFYRQLGAFLRLASTTIIELPEAGHRTSANYRVYQHWYDKSENMEDVLWKALNTIADSAMYDVRYLGAATIDFGKDNPKTTTRELYRVDVIMQPPAGKLVPLDCQHFAQCAGCASTPITCPQQQRRQHHSPSQRRNRPLVPRKHLHLRP
jgi:hypothetical protein